MFKSNQAIQKQFDRSGNVVTGRFGQMSGAAKNFARNLRPAKNATQQFGYQVQDVAVQLQAGTGAMQVMAQQGSQMASIFGPGGAVLGAIIAIGSAVVGSMLPALFSSKDAVEELEEAMESLGEVATRTADGGVITLTDEIKALA